MAVSITVQKLPLCADTGIVRKNQTEAASDHGQNGKDFHYEQNVSIELFQDFHHSQTFNACGAKSHASCNRYALFKLNRFRNLANGTQQTSLWQPTKILDRYRASESGMMEKAMDRESKSTVSGSTTWTLEIGMYWRDQSDIMTCWLHLELLYFTM